MKVFSRRVLAWLGQALPKQQIRGDGGVQIGKTGNNVTINVINQHHTTVIHGLGHGPDRVPAAAVRESCHD